MQIINSYQNLYTELVICGLSISKVIINDFLLQIVTCSIKSQEARHYLPHFYVYNELKHKSAIELSSPHAADNTLTQISESMSHTVVLKYP